MVVVFILRPASIRTGLLLAVIRGRIDRDALLDERVERDMALIRTRGKVLAAPVRRIARIGVL